MPLDILWAVFGVTFCLGVITLTKNVYCAIRRHQATEIALGDHDLPELTDDQRREIDLWMRSQAHTFGAQ